MSTTSSTVSLRGILRAIAVEAKPIIGRSSKTSTLPSDSSSTCADPFDGCIAAAAICSSVVLPAPFGPRMTQRSSESTLHVTESRIRLPSRTTDTSRNSSTVLAI